jgi:hypothetical protein
MIRPDKDIANEHPFAKKVKTDRVEIANLSKSRVKQLLQLKEEAIAKGDDDKIKIIDSELYLLRD